MNKTQETGLKKFCSFIMSTTGIKIEIGDQGPCTDGKTIFLPHLDAVSLPMARGFIFHEALHIVHTNFKAGEAYARRHYARKGCNVALAAAFANAIEDARIERLGCGVYAGAKYVLEQRLVGKTMERLTALFRDARPEAFPQVLATYVCCFAKDELMGVPLFKELLVLGHNVLAGLLGPALVQDLERLLRKELPHLAGTSECCQLSIKLCEFLQAACADARCQDGQSPQEGEKAQQSDASCSSAGSTEAVKAEALADEAGDSAEAGIQTRNLEVLLKASSAENEAENELEVGGEQRTCERQAAAASGRTDQDFDASLWTMPEAWPVEVNAVDVACGRVIVEDSLSDAGALRSVLMRLLAAKTQARTGRLAASGRKLRQSALGRLAAGDLRVMEQRSATLKNQHKFDTAVEILLDRSGSMGVDCMRAALHAALTLNLAIRRMPGCVSEILAFPGHVAPGDVEGPHQWVSANDAPVVELAGVKGVSLSTVDIGRIGMVEAFGSTPMCEAIRAALSRLEMCEEHRKMIVIITDGNVHPAQESSFRKLMQRAREGRVDVFGIFIDVNAFDAALLGGLMTAYESLSRPDAVSSGHSGRRETMHRNRRLCDCTSAIQSDFSQKLKAVVRSFACKGMFRTL